MSSHIGTLKIASRTPAFRSGILEHHKIEEVAESPRDKRYFVGELISAIRPVYPVRDALNKNLWIQEASHRANSLLNLFLMLEKRTWDHVNPSISAQLDCILVNNLLENYSLLQGGKEGALHPCAGSIRSIVTGLAELFGPTVGRLEMKTDIKQFWLCTEKRRAVSLIASEVVTNYIQHAFGKCSDAKIHLTVEPIDGDAARLTIGNNGCEIEQAAGYDSLAIVAGLTRILEGDFVIRRTSNGGTCLEITFPVSPF